MFSRKSIVFIVRTKQNINKLCGKMPNFLRLRQRVQLLATEHRKLDVTRFTQMFVVTGRTAKENLSKVGGGKQRRIIQRRKNRRQTFQFIIQNHYILKQDSTFQLKRVHLKT
jgi:hypothetical protein